MTQEISVEQLKQILEQNPDTMLIDVREPHEWQAGHIAQAKHLPLAQIEQDIETLTSAKDQPIYLQCRSGGRSAKAAAMLTQKGFQQAINVEGGITAWVVAGFDVVE